MKRRQESRRPLGEWQELPVLHVDREPLRVITSGQAVRIARPQEAFARPRLPRLRVKVVSRRDEERGNRPGDALPLRMKRRRIRRTEARSNLRVSEGWATQNKESD